MFEAIQRPVLELAESLQGTLLYLDAGAGEIAQTTLGLPFLFGLGVSNVCSLELASADDAALPTLATGHPPSRLAVFTTQLLTDAHLSILGAVLVHPAVTSVAIYCSVSEHAHACQAATDLGVEAYREYSDLLHREVFRLRQQQQQQQQQQQSTGGAPAGASAGGAAQGDAAAAAALSVAVRVQFLPLLAVCVDSGAFVFPAASSAARCAVTGAVAAGYGPADAAAEAAAGEGASGGLSLTAHALLALAAALGVSRPELFPVGPVSAALAAELGTLPAISIPSAAASASSSGGAAGSSSGPPSLALVLLDRALDLAAPTAHGEQPWDLVLAGCAARQVSAAVSAAEEASAQSSAGAGGPPQGRWRSGPQALWRPVDLRVALPDAAIPIPGELDWGPPPPPEGLPPGLQPDTRHLPYGQLSYAPYGAELLDPTDRTALARLEAVAGRGRGGRREALAALRRALKEALRAERLQPSVRSKAGAVQAPELKGLAESLLASPAACLKQRGVAALGLAVAEALMGPGAAEWEAAAGLERSCLAALAGGAGAGEAAAQVLLDALEMAKAGHGLLHAGHVLEALPAVFSAAPDSHPAASAAEGGGHGDAGPPPAGLPDCPFPPAAAAAVRGALADAVLAAPRPEAQLGGRLPAALVAALAARRRRLDGEAEPAADAQAGAQAEAEAGLELRLAAALDALFWRLQYAAAARGRLRDFRKVTHMDVFAENHGAVNPLLCQVIRKVLQRAEITDWQPQPSGGGGGGGLVRGLLGGLMGASRALVAGGGGGGGARHPAECGTVVVFVVGGVSPAEMREVRALVDEHVGPDKPRVVVGGTSLVLPQDVALQLSGGLLQ
ncbi:hypothetical protein HXX76_014963 [Chlamydomonas incerta]|uniref:Uncharacterized protein n=1 Tax=Chlamydomonas incerta TaxID=51695 RepID=A0A835VQD2_CHLIN|nr:hypothetical protein HXX76_014963 [Chlamydomonas incerta]|eukprot:KAG2423910.1 hypothetical protein HXX76_014963 [Chlamydomonas incerta]